MSSEIFVFDEPYYHHSASNMFSTENCDLQFFSDSSIDSMLQEISDDPKAVAAQKKGRISADEAQSLDRIAQALLSTSPPSHQMEGLSLRRQTHFANLPNASHLPNGFGDYSVSEAKTEDSHLGLDSSSYNSCFFGHTNGYVGESMIKFLQKSCGSHSFDGSPGLLFQRRFDTLLESSNFQAPENRFSTGQIRRVCSTGDLPVKTSHLSQNPSANECAFMEEANFKVGRYSAEERKERIDRYRAKRTHRNFTKTIRYACRKTLADNRSRIRGRFARNDEPGEVLQSACSGRYEQEDELWMDALQEERDEAAMVGENEGF
ncbi:hypothetical protein Nepgr_030709 [Nepenthes gracilis]|uniref:CCT domain-containing protein n=1 Tax=Nepenthes gracilis TaxID=150966 RepID=A0AAD3TH50_NEPGR|nr:hypothetical protein Nepgr_030709 [Nepenthes gracilis]